MSEQTTAGAADPPDAVSATSCGGLTTYVPKEQLDYCARSLKGTRDALESADTRIAELEVDRDSVLVRAATARALLMDGDTRGAMNLLFDLACRCGELSAGPPFLNRRVEADLRTSI